MIVTFLARRTCNCVELRLTWLKNDSHIATCLSMKDDVWLILTLETVFADAILHRRSSSSRNRRGRPTASLGSCPCHRSTVRDPVRALAGGEGLLPLGQNRGIDRCADSNA